MKKLFLFFNLMIAVVYANAQTNSETTLPLTKFRITKADNSVFTQASLSKNKPVMVIYFEPTCSHCEHLMTELKPKMSELNRIQVVMITYTHTEYPFLRMLKDFNKKYNLAKYPNFTVGTEYNHIHPNNYPVQEYYKIYSTPYIVIYNTQGKVVKSFTEVPSVEDLLAAVKKA